MKPLRDAILQIWTKFYANDSYVFYFISAPAIQRVSPADMSGSKFAADCLQAHNDKRKKHGVSKLKLNSELCVLAQNYAQQLLR